MLELFCKLLSYIHIYVYIYTYNTHVLQLILVNPRENKFTHFIVGVEGSISHGNLWKKKAKSNNIEKNFHYLYSWNSVSQYIFLVPWEGQIIEMKEFTMVNYVSFTKLSWSVYLYMSVFDLFDDLFMQTRSDF